MVTQSPSIWSRLSQPGVILTTIVVVGIIGLGVGWRQLRSQIFSPFAAPVSSSNEVNNLQIQAALAVDTDKDGLTDYEEINVYHTSPFVADSDSDGLNDGEEVKQGTDPNCPKGTDCSIWRNTGVSGTVATPTTTPTSTGSVSSTGANLTPQQLRDLLIQNGLLADQVQALTDDQLLAAWQEALNQSQ